MAGIRIESLGKGLPLALVALVAPEVNLGLGFLVPGFIEVTSRWFEVA